jgi:hypothetical protein
VWHFTKKLPIWLRLLLTTLSATLLTNIHPHDPEGFKLQMMLIPQQDKRGMVANISPATELRIIQNATVYAFGTVYYSDIHGVRHWSQFCYSFADTGLTMTPANFHNSCDDLEQTQKN